MPHTRGKTIGALEARHLADEKKIRKLEAHKKWAFAIQKANFKRKREDKARIAKLRLDVSEGERACVELADVKKKMAEMAEELQTLKTQLGIIIEV